MVKRFTPNGLSVNALVPAISASSSSGGIAPQAIRPKPPALDMAATRWRSDTHDIAPHRIATSDPRKAAPRAMRRCRRSAPIEVWFMPRCLALRGALGQVRWMQLASDELQIETRGLGLLEITDRIEAWVAESGIATGLLTLFARHTSASLLIQENAAPAARRDVERYFARIAPESAAYEHDDEGPDDMPAHLRAALTATSLSIPVVDGRTVLGTWQGIYLFEHRPAPDRRLSRPQAASSSASRP